VSVTMYLLFTSHPPFCILAITTHYEDAPSKHLLSR